MHVQAADQAHLLSATELHHTTWHLDTAPRFSPTLAERMTMDHFARVWRQVLELRHRAEAEVFIALDGTEVVGTATVGRPTSTHYSSDLPSASWEVGRLNVHPHRHGQGIGSALLQECQRWIVDRRGMGVLWTPVPTDRHDQVYGHNGWTVNSTTIEMYADEFVPVNRYVFDPHGLADIRPEISGHTVVIKAGGDLVSNSFTRKRLIANLPAGSNVVLVIGAGTAISNMQRGLGDRPVYRDNLRLTSAETITNMDQLLRSATIPSVVAEMARHEVSYVECPAGVCVSSPIDLDRYGFVGAIDHVDTAWMAQQFDQGRAIVVGPLHRNFDAATATQSDLVNVNADLVAGAIAAALRADELTFYSSHTNVATGSDKGPGATLKQQVANAVGSVGVRVTHPNIHMLRAAAAEVIGLGINSAG